MTTRRLAALILLLMTALAPGASSRAAEQPAGPAILKSEFIDDHPAFPTSHASTIVETPDGLLAAWFGGTRERATDVSIWLARNDGSGWSAPEEVANGWVVKEGRRYPCWNPVLYRRANGDLLLFYKVGPSPETWWGMLRLSTDNGRTWSAIRRLPGGYVGPVRNKPIELPGSILLCPSSSENKGWRVHMERSHNPFGIDAWERTPALNAAESYAAIQPTILPHSEQVLQILCRTKQGWITECWSTNTGITWSAMRRTSLPNPNSAIDGVRLRDGRFLLVYNHSRDSRSALHVGISDDGARWQAGAVLESEPGAEFSYPAVIQTADGLVHITYTWKRQKIRHVVLDPARLAPRDFVDGRWP